MRCFAVVVVSLVLFAGSVGCSAPSDGAIPVGHGGSDNAAGSDSVADAGDSAAAGGSGSAASAGSNSVGEAGSTPTMGSEGGDAGSAGQSAQAGSGGGGTNGGGGTDGAPATVPNTPTGLALQVASATTVSLTWSDDSTDETGFNVYWSTTADKPGTPNLQQPANSVNAVADGLVAQQAYTFWVEAFNSAGVSASVSGVATPVPVPAQPTSLIVTGGETVATLTWGDAATDETGYRVYYSTTNVQPSTPKEELPKDTTTYTVPAGELTPYALYYFWVVAYDAAGNGMPATGSGTVGVVPTPPTGLTVDASGKVWYVLASWADNSSSATSYNIYWSTDTNKPAQPEDTVPAGTTSYKMKQVLSGQTYRFWVETVNAVGKSSATMATADKPTFDVSWTELYYLQSDKTVHQTVQDTFGLVGDILANGQPDTTTGIYGYYSSSSTFTGAGTAMTPSVAWAPATAAIDTTVTGYYQTELRTPLGSVFSTVKALVPPAPVLGLTAGPSTDLTQVLSWTASANASSYQVYVGTSTLALATLYASPGFATPGTTVTTTIRGLNPGVPYNYWVRALGAGLGGTGYTAVATISQTTTGTYLGPNLALGKTAVGSTVYGGALASNVNDGNFGSRWQGSYSTGEWIYINLGDGVTAKFTNVELVWEAAYSKTFDIQVCAAACDDVAAVLPDNWAWQTVYSSPTNAFPSTPYYQMLTLTTQATGQFIRMKSKSLAMSSTAYGPSLYEFELFGAP